MMLMDTVDLTLPESLKYPFRPMLRDIGIFTWILRFSEPMHIDLPAGDNGKFIQSIEKHP